MNDQDRRFGQPHYGHGLVEQIADLQDEVNRRLRTMVDSTSDERVVNNVMRHEYRVLSESEKHDMQMIKDHGLHFHTFIEALETRHNGPSRELSLAKTKIEEAVMWATKHITR